MTASKSSISDTWNAKVEIEPSDWNEDHQQSNFQILQEYKHQLSPYSHDMMALGAPKKEQDFSLKFVFIKISPTSNTVFAA